MRIRLAVLASAAVAAGCGGATAGGSSMDTDATTSASAPAPDPAPATVPARRAAAPADWPMFGRVPSRTSATGSIGIAHPGALKRRRVSLPGVVDSAPIYLRGRFVMTTTYGRTISLDATSGKIAWVFTPSGYDSWKGSYRIMNASPVASADRRFVYAGSPDGRVHKLAMASGKEEGGNWPVTITKLPQREKVTPSFGLAGGRLIVGTGGYVGDQPPYQGHIVAIDAGDGHIIGVTNSLCADRHEIIAPSSCQSSDSAIWSRSGAVRMADGTWLFATGNGPFDGRRDFGDSVVRVSADARRLLGSWTPSTQAQLNSSDTDLGSTGPVLIGGGSVLQSGKDGRLHVIAASALNHVGTVGHERQNLPAPGASQMFTAPAVWRSGGQTWIFATTDSGTAGYVQTGGRLHLRWSLGTGGTSPIVAGGLLWVYDASSTLTVYHPTTGKVVARLPAGSGHWNSPAPGNGSIALPEGNANDHTESGILNLYHR